ncbi:MULTISPECIES: hypothetical protein [Mumia]|uniref:Htaa protein n=1 Tax=Mumia xiangluensis TaxID=1678900 RepID=A0ABW1QNC3_9ACTN|nr:MULTISPECIES: hypothetical protein [Mumia]
MIGPTRIATLGATAVALAVPTVATAVVTTAPAVAAARITVTNGSGAATATTDGTTTLTVTGRGFQSIKGGAGGIYVAFGWVSDPDGSSWKPSKGGLTGDDYRYVPDSESASNAGHQRFLAFPGAETADSANGTISASGGWSTTLTVPGAVFQSVDRSGKAVDVDCTKVTCGVITIGAHGIKNPTNETFTPVRFVAGPSSTGAPKAAATQAPAAAPAATVPPAAPRAARPSVGVDRATAVVGRVLTFTGKGFLPGEQVVATLDDGIAAVGPLSAGQSGEVAGVLQLPASITAGTHVLKLSGAASGAVPTVTFPIAPAPAVVDATVDESASDDGPTTAAWIFMAAAGLLLLLAVIGAFLRVRRARSRRPDAPASAPTASDPLAAFERGDTSVDVDPYGTSDRTVTR